MNMNFHRPQEFDLQFLHDDRTTVLKSQAAKSEVRFIHGKHLRWLFVGLAAAYIVTKATAVTLLIVAGAFLALLGVATAVCIYAQNNIR
jgi:hypothetical protein